LKFARSRLLRSRRERPRRCCCRAADQPDELSPLQLCPDVTAANLFIFLDVHRPWRKVKVTERRSAEDYAHCMREVVDVHCPDAERIRVVQDNLSTHSAGALYQAFPPAEARRILRRLEFHYTPKHASWLNMVEIEIGVLRGQCLDRRIDSKEQLEAEIAAWEHQRNASGARI
jgi:DDE superfamily endonuclease